MEGINAAHKFVFRWIFIVKLYSGFLCTCSGAKIKYFLSGNALLNTKWLHHKELMQFIQHSENYKCRLPVQMKQFWFWPTLAFLDQNISDYQYRTGTSSSDDKIFITICLGLDNMFLEGNDWHLNWYQESKLEWACKLREFRVLGKLPIMVVHFRENRKAKRNWPRNCMCAVISENRMLWVSRWWLQSDIPIALLEIAKFWNAKEYIKNVVRWCTKLAVIKWLEWHLKGGYCIEI